MKKDAMQNKAVEVEDWGEGKCANHQRFLWDLMEKPHTSLAAKVDLNKVAVRFLPEPLLHYIPNIPYIPYPQS